jgi:hypothetical protein
MRTLPFAAALSLALFAPVASATSLNPFIDLEEQGLTLVSDSAGLQGWTGIQQLHVNVGGSVRFALLYWNGSAPCTETSPGSGVCAIPYQPFLDQAITLDGQAVLGTIIGTETQLGMNGTGLLHVGYFADVTSLVANRGTGLLDFLFVDANFGDQLSPLQGVGLLVAYTDPASTSTYRLLIHDGLDFAAATAFTPGDNRTTAPVVFQHGSSEAARQGQLFLFAGGSKAALPDRVTVGGNADLVNTLDASSGDSFDGDVHTVDLPAGASSTAVQVASVVSTVPTGCGPGYWKNHTDAWPPTGFSPSQHALTVFPAVPNALGNQTLLAALDGGGGKGTLGAAQILLRSAVAALLDAAHPSLAYPRTVAQVIADVNAAFASAQRHTMLALAVQLDLDDGLMCDFAGPAASDAILWQVAALRVPVDVNPPSRGTEF